MKATKTQIKKANKGLNSKGLNMTKLENGTLHVGIVSVLDMDNQEVINTLNAVRFELSKTDNLNKILWMSFFN
tara:strand:- start:535 stop:753 length:219 start_codon:yes stop_codon:yes gene_type:complete